MQPVENPRPGIKRLAQQHFDRRDVRYHQHRAAAVVGDDPVPRPGDSLIHGVEAFSARRLCAGVAQPASMQFGIVFGGLSERESLPCAEIGFDQVVVDGDVQAQPFGGRGRGVVAALQR